jgi:predicted O-methyltransferase YrrM
VDELLSEYEARQTEEDILVASMTRAEIGRRRDELLVSIGRQSGVFLNLVARESQAHSILELGTGFGYSTIWLAEAARVTGGQVTTVDVVAAKQERAKSAIAQLGLQDFVHFVHSDALEFLAVTRGSYDFVLIDLWKDLYIPSLDGVLSRLNAKAMIVADNMLKPAATRLAASRYQAYVRSVAALETIVLPIGSGLAVSRLR